MEDRLRDKPDAFAKRQYIHAHNMKFGGVRHAQMWMLTITLSPSSSEETKEIARRINLDLDLLYKSLETRVGP